MEEIIIIRTSDLDGRVFRDLMNVLRNQKIQVISSNDEDKMEVISFPDLKINRTFHKVICHGQDIKLTALEYHLLVYLAVSPGRVYTKTQIYEEVYGQQGACNIDNSIYCLVKSLRRKIEENPKQPKYIQTVWGIGYRFCETQRSYKVDAPKLAGES